MSAFIVSDETMHRVVQALDHVKPAPNNLTRTIIGRMLFGMNNTALRERYGDRYPEDMTNPEHYEYQQREATTGELFKAVACFTYQCAEGDVPNSKLFKLVSGVEHELAVELVGEDSEDVITRAMRKTEGLPWDF